MCDKSLQTFNLEVRETITDMGTFGYFVTLCQIYLDTKLFKHYINRR